MEILEFKILSNIKANLFENRFSGLEHFLHETADTSELRSNDT